MNILQDIKTAVKLTGEIRKARKEGATLETHKVWLLPEIKITYWGWTIEAGHMCGTDMGKAVRDVFYTLPEETQHALTFTPKEPRGWIDRARFWQRELKPALEPKTYHEVMLLLIGLYAKCLRKEKVA